MTIEEGSIDVLGLVSDKNSTTNSRTITSNIAQSEIFNRSGRGRVNQRGGESSDRHKVH